MARYIVSRYGKRYSQVQFDDRAKLVRYLRAHVGENYCLCWKGDVCNIFLNPNANPFEVSSHDANYNLFDGFVSAIGQYRDCYGSSTLKAGFCFGGC